MIKVFVKKLEYLPKTLSLQLPKHRQAESRAFSIKVRGVDIAEFVTGNEITAPYVKAFCKLRRQNVRGESEFHQIPVNRALAEASWLLFCPSPSATNATNSYSLASMKATLPAIATNLDKIIQQLKARFGIDEQEPRVHKNATKRGAPIDFMHLAINGENETIAFSRVAPSLALFKANKTKTGGKLNLRRLVKWLNDDSASETAQMVLKNEDRIRNKGPNSFTQCPQMGKLRALRNWLFSVIVSMYERRLKPAIYAIQQSKNGRKNGENRRQKRDLQELKVAMVIFMTAFLVVVILLFACVFQDPRPTIIVALLFIAAMVLVYQDCFSDRPIGVILDEQLPTILYGSSATDEAGPSEHRLMNEV